MSEPSSGGAEVTGGPPLEQLIYASVSTTRVTSALQMSDILAVARPRNAKDRITGALTATRGRFVQIIEGPASALDDLMNRLAKDGRHRAIQVLARRPIEARAFGDWDMISPRLVFEEAEALGEMLNREAAGLDDYIAIFRRALARQDALLADGQGADLPSMTSTRPQRPAAPDRPEPEA